MGVKRRLRGKQPQIQQLVFPVANKTKRSYVKTRVQFHGVRLSCSAEKHFELQAVLVQEVCRRTVQVKLGLLVSTLI